MHSQSNSKTSRKPNHAKKTAAQKQAERRLRRLRRPSVFIKQFAQLLNPRQLGGIRRQLGPRKGGEAKLGAFLFMALLVFHALQPKGTYSAHARQLTGIKLSGAAIAKRRQRLGWRVFESVLNAVLRTRASLRRHRNAFYQGLLLVGIDGTLFSVFNTPAVIRQLTKARSRRGYAAFAQIRACLLVELGLHNPLALAVGASSDSEITLAHRLIDRIPPRSLLLADRLYGHGRFLLALLHRFVINGSDFLVRVPSRHTSRLIEKLPDGSMLIEIKGIDTDGQKFKFWVREIRGVIRGRGRRRTVVRLWTSLLECDRHPAIELLRLYAQRWEQEIAFKELKVEMRHSSLLNSYTPLTAMQEVAAFVIAQAMLVEWRIQAGDHLGVTPLRISFAMLLTWVRSLWSTLALLDGIVRLSAQQEARLAERLFDLLGDSLTPPRRNRSCPRAVRQPVSSWPRLMHNRSSRGEFHFEVIRKYRSQG